MASIQDIQEVEISIEIAKQMIAKREMVKKLQANREFKKLITEGLLKEEAARSAVLYSDPSISETTRAHVLRDIGGYGLLERYFRTIVRMADEMEAAMKDDENTLEELHSEEMGVIIDPNSDEYDENEDGDDE